MNLVVARLTLATVLGRRRALVLALVPAVLLVVAVVFRLVAGTDELVGVGVIDGLGVGTLLPVLCVVVGTSVIGPEIEDGAIVYLLSKPLSRGTIVRTKLAVAIGVSWVLGALPVGIAGLVLLGPGDLGVALVYAIVAAVAAVVYCSMFLLLGVLTGNAVVIGLLYALIWETTVASIVSGAAALSVRQWALSLGESLLGPDASARLGVDAALVLPVAVVLMVLVVVGATWWATRLLGRLGLSAPE